jgi:Uncharacterised conserved protein (DUF2228)
MKRKLDPYEDVRDSIEAVFHLKAPQSMFDLWEICQSVNPSEPGKALEPINMRLVGPFDFLANKKSLTDGSTWRYFYDPPEYTTCIISTLNPTLHWGWFRDNPGDLPCAIFENDSKIDCKFKPTHRTIFGPINDAIKRLDSNHPLVYAFASVSVDSTGPPGAEFLVRKKKILGQTINGFGVVVPYDKERDVGYRKLSVNQTQLISIFQKIKNAEKEQRNTKPLEELINWVNIANDECDFGMGYELGCNLLCADTPYSDLVFSKAAMLVLKNAYKLIGGGRDLFVHVLEELITTRKLLLEKFGKNDKYPGCPLSIERN